VRRERGGNDQATLTLVACHQGAAIAACTRMGDLFAMLLLLDTGVEATNLSGLLGTMIWMLVIVVVMVCLLILAIVGLSASNKTKT
jgi:heme/copper-type cytochrome/quinol oxidase subunit 2